MMRKAVMPCEEPLATPLVKPSSGRGPKPMNRESRSLRICFVSPLGYGLYHQEAKVPFGGAEVQSYLSARALARVPGFDVSVLTTVDGEPFTESIEGLRLIARRTRGRLTEESMDGIVSGSFAVRRYTGYMAALWEMWAQFRDIDADVYIHAGAGVEVGAYALICRLLRRHFIYVIASSVDLTLPYGSVSGPLKWLYPFGMRHARAVICRTEDQQAALHHGYRRHGIVIRTAHPIPPMSSVKRRSVLWAGRIHPLKQPRLFLDLVERCPEQTHVMVGMRDSTQTELWESICSRARGLPNLSFEPNLPLHRMDELFATARVFVNTSAYEGFPNTFVQATLSGVPIVSWTVNPDRILTDQRIGFCAEGSFDQLVLSVRRLSLDDRLYEDYARRARTYGVEYHSLERSVSQLQELLVSLAFSNPH